MLFIKVSCNLGFLTLPAAPIVSFFRSSVEGWISCQTERVSWRHKKPCSWAYRFEPYLNHMRRYHWVELVKVSHINIKSGLSLFCIMFQLDSLKQKAVIFSITTNFIADVIHSLKAKTDIYLCISFSTYVKISNKCLMDILMASLESPSC